MNGHTGIHVFLAKPEALLHARGAEEATRLVDEADQAHITRFRFQADRQIALASRLLQRLAIARVAAVPRQQIRDLRFSSAPGQRPALLEPGHLQSLHFSAANTRGLVACAVSTAGVVGMDVEQVQARLAPELLAHCCTRDEVYRLSALSEDRRRKSFFELWTLKESYLKAKGIGLQLSPHRIGFEISDPGHSITLRTEPGVEPDPTHWHFSLLDAGDQHAAAVCAHAPPGHAPGVTRWQGRWDGEDFALAALGD